MMIRSIPLTVLLTLAPVLAGAQALGTFRWQLEPYCNIVTLAVTQSGSVYEIEGTDDQCGAATAASASGTAFLNPDGSIGFGLNIVTSPSATPVHVEASIGLATLSGTWHDSAGATGTFRFTPGAGIGGAARPAAGNIGAASVNASQVQLRVSGSCASGTFMQSVGETGSVSCGSALGGVSSVHAGYGLASSGSPANVSLQVNLEQIKSGLEIRTPDVTSLALGADALPQATTPAFGNTAVGVRALWSNTTGLRNVAVGHTALQKTTAGNYNVAVGFGALGLNATGSGSVAIGDSALAGVVGSDNIAIGASAGSGLSSGSNNIAIGSLGASGEQNTIRIGDLSHTRTFIGGIRGQTAPTGAAVYISTTGALGTLTSSARFKEDIQPIGDVRGKLAALKPVRFVYRAEYDDGSRAPQFGLIAEDVAATFPELALLDDSGHPETVRYHLLTPLLLAEIQRLERERAAQADQLKLLREEVAGLRDLVAQRPQ